MCFAVSYSFLDALGRARAPAPDAVGKVHLTYFGPELYVRFTDRSWFQSEVLVNPI